ncbi:hypothetical protein PFDSM3638_09995 [Pyrococcus furiosus DSM 3638]|uniref:Uncharacterized protein n=3 Tax=Pyrococcus furiosus TaxID=2261 RepID=A0A5C0XS17_PYRFU|nr:hypothetical protein [Pyrococcus furiosus]AAL82108.1 hypothetical protein PF1984 [Pyrococcus furiosus DSM 3638]AFN04657.1 hypothetical protein PFC_08660 [Pyrococcus furiosus COM1]QEK79579.1 hypothetical protein PFDSM3638_09995 [Pyrococcus furiosus DSM 3638]
MVGSVYTLFLYFSIILGVIVGVRTRSFHSSLAVLVFSSTFVAGIKYNNSYIAIISWLALSTLSSYLFHLNVIIKSRKDESVSNVLMGYLLGFFILLTLKLHGAGWILSILASYWVFYILLMFDYSKNRRAYYLLKTLWIIFSWGALIEAFGLQKELLPFLVVYTLIFILWFKRQEYSPT